jgi:hypothetical protein
MDKRPNPSQSEICLINQDLRVRCLAGSLGKQPEEDLMRRARRAMYSLLLMIAVMWQASAASADVLHEKDSWFNRVEIGHDFNICGDLATFTVESTGHVITTETARGFHITFVDNDVYTVDFDDPALGTWTARATETSTFNATPGDVITLHVGNNNIEGDVRIRELVTLVIGPGGEVRVDREVFEVVGC